MLNQQLERTLRQWFSFDNHYTFYNTHDDTYSSTDTVRLIDMTAKKLPVKFHTVRSFYCNSFMEHGGALTSLVGAPILVSDWFECREHKIRSLKGCPAIVGDNFDCRDNLLTNLLHGPKKVGRQFDCSKNPLTSLDGMEDIEFDIIILPESPKLPMLKLMTTKKRWTFHEKGAGYIVYNYKELYDEGKLPLKQAMWQCQQEMVQNGFDGNATW
jgi:hypothetical protein